MNNDIGLIALNGFRDRAEELNNYVCRLTGANKNYLIDFSNPRFSNGESKLVLNETVREKDIYIIADIGNYSCTYNIYGYENHMSPDEHYIDIIRTLSAISGKAKRTTLILPLMYASRQHRRSARESLDCAMALRYFESLGVNNIITLDIHDPEVQNTIPTGSFDSIFPVYHVLKHLIATEKENISKDKMVVISPDAGALNRARKYASLLNLHMGFFNKRRDYTRVVDGKNPILEHEYVGPDVKDKHILVVDDMISSGESILDLASELNKRGAKGLYVVSSFAFFTNGIDKFNKAYEDGLIKKVFSTNGSYIRDEIKNAPWFEEISVTDLFAEVIVTLNRNQSLSRLIDQTDNLNELLSELN